MFKVASSERFSDARRVQHTLADHLHTCKGYLCTEVFCNNLRTPLVNDILFNLATLLYRSRIEKYTLPPSALIARGTMIIRQILGPIFSF